MTRGRLVVVAVLALTAVFGAFVARGAAQTPPIIPLPPLSTTTTTAPPPSSDGGSGDSSTTAPPDGSGTGDGTATDPNAPPPADTSQDGDNSSPVGGGPGQFIPPDAEAELDSIVRSGGNDDHLLVAGEKAMLAAGIDPDQAAPPPSGPGRPPRLRPLPSGRSGGMGRRLARAPFHGHDVPLPSRPRPHRRLRH